MVIFQFVMLARLPEGTCFWYLQFWREYVPSHRNFSRVSIGQSHHDEDLGELFLTDEQMSVFQFCEQL